MIFQPHYPRIVHTPRRRRARVVWPFFVIGLACHRCGSPDDTDGIDGQNPATTDPEPRSGCNVECNDNASENDNNNAGCSIDPGASGDTGSSSGLPSTAGGGDDEQPSRCWERVKRLDAVSQSEPITAFGFAVDIYGDLIAVTGTVGTGAQTRPVVSLYGRNEGGLERWGVLTSIIVPESGYETGGSGLEPMVSVALHAGVLVVGTYRSDAGVGSAHVYRQDAANPALWIASARLSPTEAQDRWFGVSVAVDNDRIAVGASGAPTGANGGGAVYLFGQDVGGSNAWGQIVVHRSGVARGAFGHALALADDRLVVGAYGERSGNDSGAVRIYVRDLGGPDLWGEARSLRRVSAQDIRFGTSVAMDDDVAVVGADFRATEEASSDGGGEAYVFWRDQGGSGTWGLTDAFAPAGPADPRVEEGVPAWPVGATVGRVVVGVPFESGNSWPFEAGAVYVYDRFGQALDGVFSGTWGAVARFDPEEETLEQFGRSVSVARDTVVVGSGSRTGIGAAYVYVCATDGDMGDEYGVGEEAYPGAGDGVDETDTAGGDGTNETDTAGGAGADETATTAGEGEGDGDGDGDGEGDGDVPCQDVLAGYTLCPAGDSGVCPESETCFQALLCDPDGGVCLAVTQLEDCLKPDDACLDPGDVCLQPAGSTGFVGYCLPAEVAGCIADAQKGCWQ
ncbi:MAG: hypothetical protein V3V08_19025 [Nannocystaceae bacterium]